MYLFKNGLLPENFNEMFSLNCDVHSYNTRSKNSFHLPYCRTNGRKFSLCFQGPNLFTCISLSPGIHNASSIAVFTSKLFLIIFLGTSYVTSFVLVCTFLFFLFFSFCPN